MIKELRQLEALFLESYQLHISNVQPDNTFVDYLGHDFKIDAANVKFRKAKLTPKKNGLFVTLWYRNEAGITTPFHLENSVDFYLIFTEDNDQQGCYIFPKAILAKNNILSTNAKEGKRGFRVYPDWCKPESKQAEKTQKWQNEYFVNLADNAIDTKQRLQLLNMN